MKADSFTSARNKYLIFHLAGRAYGIPTDSMEEIIPMLQLSIVPASSSVLSGVLDIGGEFVAAISMRRLLGLPDQERELFTPLVILKPRPQRFALEIDGVSGIVEVRDDEWAPVAEGCSLNDCAAAVVRIQSRPVVLLSPERILMEQEQRCVADLAELAQRRLAAIEAVTQ